MNNRIIIFFQTFWVLFRISKELWGDCTSIRTKDVNSTLLFFYHSPLRSIILKMWTIMNHRILFFLKCSIVNFLFSTMINWFFLHMRTLETSSSMEPISWRYNLEFFIFYQWKKYQYLEANNTQTTLICILLFKKRKVLMN